MLKDVKISADQFRTLVVLCFVGPSIVNIPSLMTGEVQQDGWIAVILGVVVGLLLIWLYTKTGDLFPNMNLFEASEFVLGKWAGKILSLFFIFFLLMNTAALIYIPGNFLVTQVIPGTPIVVVNSLFVITIIIGVRYGLETTVRAAEIFFPWFLTGILFLLVFSAPLIELKNFKPILENGLKPMLKATLYFEAFIPLTMVPLLVIYPKYISNLKEGKKTFFQGSIIAGIIILLITIWNISILGSDITARHLHPTYSLAKKVNIGEIITRIEAIEAMVWIIALFYKTYIYFFAAIVGLVKVFNLADYRPLTFPIGMISIILSVIVYPNIVYAGEWDTTTWIPYVLTNGFLIPLFLILGGYFKKRYLKDKKKSSEGN